MGTEIPVGVGRVRLDLSLHCHHQNDSCIKMGIAESHFNVSSVVGGQSQKDNVPRPQLLKREGSRSESNRGPSAYQHSAFPLGQAGSQTRSHEDVYVYASI